MPVLPLVGSINTVLPGWIFPARSASLIMLTPMRSFTLLHGFWLSSLATTVAFAPAVTLLRRTRGVFPISSVTSFAIFIAISGKFDLKPLDIWFDSAEASKESAKGNNNILFGTQNIRHSTQYIKH